MYIACLVKLHKNVTSWGLVKIYKLQFLQTKSKNGKITTEIYNTGSTKSYTFATENK